MGGSAEGDPRDAFVQRPPRREGTRVVHGRRSSYLKYGCRCPDCRAAQTEYQNEKRRRDGVPERPESWGEKRKTHGERSCYVSGCRCDECTRANRDYQREMMRMYRSGYTAADFPDPIG